MALQTRNRAGRAASPRAVDCWILTQAQKPGAGWAGASATVNDDEWASSVCVTCRMLSAGCAHTR